MKLNIVKNPALKKGLGVASAVVMGIVTISQALADRQREEEFEDLKKTVSELKSKNGES